MARGSFDYRRALTLGGQAPLPIGLVLALTALVTIGGTVWPALAGLVVLAVPGGDAAWTALLEPWRLLTWPLYLGPLPQSLITFLFAGFMLLWLGRQLSYAWSERRFLGRVALLTVGAGALTLLVLLLLGGGVTYDAGLWPLANALLITWGLLYPNQSLSWFGALQMRGATVTTVFTWGTPLWALLVGSSGGRGLLGGLVLYLPHLASVAMAWLLAAGGPRRYWARVKEPFLKARLARQRRKFQVIDTEPRGGSRSKKDWMN